MKFLLILTSFIASTIAANQNVINSTKSPIVTSTIFITLLTTPGLSPTTAFSVSNTTNVPIYTTYFNQHDSTQSPVPIITSTAFLTLITTPVIYSTAAFYVSNTIYVPISATYFNFTSSARIETSTSFKILTATPAILLTKSYTSNITSIPMSTTFFLLTSSNLFSKTEYCVSLFGYCSCSYTDHCRCNCSTDKPINKITESKKPKTAVCKKKIF